MRMKATAQIDIDQGGVAGTTDKQWQLHSRGFGPCTGLIIHDLADDKAYGFHIAGSVSVEQVRVLEALQKSGHPCRGCFLRGRKTIPPEQPRNDYFHVGHEDWIGKSLHQAVTHCFPSLDLKPDIETNHDIWKFTYDKRQRRLTMKEEAKFTEADKSPLNPDVVLDDPLEVGPKKRAVKRDRAADQGFTCPGA